MNIEIPDEEIQSEIEDFVLKTLKSRKAYIKKSIVPNEVASVTNEIAKQAVDAKREQIKAECIAVVDAALEKTLANIDFESIVQGAVENAIINVTEDALRERLTVGQRFVLSDEMGKIEEILDAAWKARTGGSRTSAT